MRGVDGEVTGAEHGFDLSRFRNLIQWAERIDSASFTDAEEAVLLPHPALKLMLFLEGNTNPELEHEVIQTLASGKIEAVWENSRISEAFEPIWKVHQDSIQWTSGACLTLWQMDAWLHST